MPSTVYKKDYSTSHKTPGQKRDEHRQAMALKTPQRRGGQISDQNSEDLVFGQRKDGSEKGLGFFGVLKRPGGGISTELSIGVNIGGDEVEIPMIVPGLTKSELDYLLEGGGPTRAIVDKAVRNAKRRMSRGISPFAGEGEQSLAPK